ncbi:MAG: PAS domain S-box protein [Desulfobacteraceae bacterium]|jgi:PAS domain S-box-containing protein
MKKRLTQSQRINELEKLLEQAEQKSDILTNLLKEASAEFNQVLDKISQSEANFRAIIESAPEAIYMFDVQTRRILDCNPYTTEWLGYSRQELIGMGVEDILGPTASGVDENIRKVLEHGYVRIQERHFRTKSGALVDAEVTGTGVEVQGKKCFVALVRDITERKKIEALLRYKELFQNVIDPVFICHSQGNFLEVNDVACERLKYTHKQMLQLSFQDIVRPSQYGVLRKMGKIIRSGEAVQFELETLTRTGEMIPFELHSRLIEFQRKPAILSVARDLSARKRMEETLIRTERLSAVGEMAAGVAHNFNNLLQMMLGAGEAAMAKLDTGEIRKSRDVLLTLIDACHRGADIVRRIKDFTLAKTDHIDQAKVFDLGELVSEAVQLTKPLWANPVDLHKYSLNFVRPLSALVKGNPSELYEVLVNVIKNALEAMPDGGILAIAPAMRNGKIYLSISDTGIGIAEENMQRLFEPFFTTKGLKSSGLGLSSSYGIIKKHHGEMIVKSEPGKGSTFTIILPRAEALSMTEARPLPEKLDLPEDKIKFLVVDDEKNILKMMELYFEDTAIDLTTVSSAEQGLAAIYRDSYDVVLCDFSMDGMNGLQLCKAAKQHIRETGQSQMKCLLYTGLSQKLEPDELKRCGVDGVVRKPVPCAELQRIVQEAVAGSCRLEC